LLRESCGKVAAICRELAGRNIKKTRTGKNGDNARFTFLDQQNGRANCITAIEKHYMDRGMHETWYMEHKYLLEQQKQI
jgi:hypothetical protein